MLRALKRLIHGDDKLWLAAAKIFVGNGNGDASAVAPCGDLTVDSAGSFAIGTSKITAAMIGTAVVSNAKLAALAVSNAQVVASTINAAKLQYTPVSITISVVAASTTSCYAILAITSGAKLLGIWPQTVASGAVDSFVWKVTNGVNSIKVDITSLTGMTTELIFKGVVIEP